MMLLTRREALGVVLAGWAQTGAGVAAEPLRATPEPTVTLSLDKAPLTLLASELTRQTSVKHRVVGREAKRPILIGYCRNQSVVSVRRAVGELLGWSWARETNGGETSYTLFKSVRAQQLERELRARYEVQYRDVLSGMVAAAADPNWKPRPGEVLDYQIASESSGAVLRSAAVLPETIRNAVVGGRPYVGRAGTLGGSFGDVVKKTWNQVADGRTLRADDPIRLEIVRDPLGRPDYFQLTIQRVEFRAGHAGFVYDSMPDALSGQASKRRMLEMYPEFAVRLPKQPPLKWPEPPAPEPSFIGWNLRDLSRRVDRSFLADYSSSVENEIESLTPKPFSPPAADGKRLSAVLEEITDPYYTWRPHDEWILLRYRWWYWETASVSGIRSDRQRSVR